MRALSLEVEHVGLGESRGAVEVMGCGEHYTGAKAQGRSGIAGVLLGGAYNGAIEQRESM